MMQALRNNESKTKQFSVYPMPESQPRDKLIKCNIAKVNLPHIGLHSCPTGYSARPQAGETPGAVRTRITAIINNLSETSLEGLGPTDFIIVFTLLCDKLKSHIS